MSHRPSNVGWQLVGIIMLIPGFLHVPLPQADFHIIRHHHGVGEVCLQHDHLVRWHPLADESEDVAILHWHWLLPQELDLMLGDAAPALHAHVVDSLQPEWNGDQGIVSSEGRVGIAAADDLASWLDLALIGAASVDSISLASADDSAVARCTRGDAFNGAAISRLARWNC